MTLKTATSTLGNEGARHHLEAAWRRKYPTPKEPKLQLWSRRLGWYSPKRSKADPGEAADIDCAFPSKSSTGRPFAACAAAAEEGKIEVEVPSAAEDKGPGAGGVRPPF